MGTKGKVRSEVSKKGEKRYTLCGVDGCCPTITLTKGGDYVIKDDFGGNVTLSKTQFDLLKMVEG